MAKKHDDRLTIITHKVEKFISTNSKIILISLAAIVVFLGSYLFVHYLNTTKEEEAETAFGKVYLAYKNIVDDTSLDSDAMTKKLLDLNDKFQIVIDEHPGTMAASKSEYFIGNIYFRAGKYRDALEHFNNGSGIKPKSYSAMLCLLGAGRSYEQLKDFKNGVDVYLQIIERYEKTFIIPSVYYSLAEIYEQMEDRESAQKEYEKIVSDYAWSAWADLAEKKILLLKSTAKSTG